MAAPLPFTNFLFPIGKLFLHLKMTSFQVSEKKVHLFQILSCPKWETFGKPTCLKVTYVIFCSLQKEPLKWFQKLMQMRGRIDIWNTYIIYELLYHTVIWVHFSTWIQKFEVLATPPCFPFLTRTFDSILTFITEPRH